MLRLDKLPYAGIYKALSAPNQTVAAGGVDFLLVIDFCKLRRCMMRKEWGNRTRGVALLLGVLAIALVIVIPAVAAAKGPVKKATGAVSISLESFHMSFSAHEGSSTRPAKGSAYTRGGETGREGTYTVRYVLVSGNEAWFAAICDYDSANGANEGMWLFIRVYDGGTPGVNGDYIGWDWRCRYDEECARSRVVSMDITRPPKRFWPVIEGNLVVHTHPE